MSKKLKLTALVLTVTMMLGLILIPAMAEGTMTVGIMRVHSSNYSNPANNEAPQTNRYVQISAEGKLTDNGALVSNYVSAGVGKILFHVSEDIDINSLSAETIAVENVSDSTIVPAGYELTSGDPYRVVSNGAKANDVIVLKLPELLPGKSYRVTLKTGILSADGEKNLVEKVLNFTTKSSNEYFYKDFNSESIGATNWLQTKPVNDTAAVALGNYLVREGTAAATDIAEVRYDSQIDRNVLFIETPKTVAAGRFDAYYYFPNAVGGDNHAGIKTAFEYETKIKFASNTSSGYITRAGFGATSGHREMEGLGRWDNTDFRVLKHFPYGSSIQGTPDIMTTVNTNIYYKIKTVYRIGEDERYVMDIYIDEGSGYRLVREGIRSGADTSANNQSGNVKRLTLLEMRHQAESVALELVKSTQASIDFMRVSDHTTVQIINSDIKNGQEGVDADTDTVSFVFSKNMDVASFVNNVKLTNKSTSAVTNLTGSFDNATKTFTAVIPAGFLTGNTNYSITLDGGIGKIKTADAYKLEGNNVIDFTTAAVTSPIRLTKPVDFSLSYNPNPTDIITNITGLTQFNAKVFVENLTDADVPVTMLMLLYDDQNRIQKIYIRDDKVVPSNGLADANLTWTGLSPIPVGYSIKVMVWDRDGQNPFAGLTPLVKASSIIAK